jgi:serine/threonine protein kinase
MVKSKILIDEEENVRITDIGLFTMTRGNVHISSSSSKDSKDKWVPRSVRWMAPELFNNKGKRNRTTDIYAFGMTMLEVRFMKPSFRGSFLLANHWILDIHRLTSFFGIRQSGASHLSGEGRYSPFTPNRAPTIRSALDTDGMVLGRGFDQTTFHT